MPRLFIGLSVPAAVAGPLAELAALALQGPGAPGVPGGVPGGVPDGAPDGVRVYPARDLHLTLCFLGEHAGGARLERALVDETRGLAAPELRIVGVGAFPDFDAPRVLWAGVVDDSGAEGRLSALHNRALTTALGTGWRRPSADAARPFRAHVTLARVAERAAGRLDLTAFRALRPRGAWVASEVALFESDPQRPEGRYRVVADAPLAVRPG